jgi:hypothetical protein
MLCPNVTSGTAQMRMHVFSLEMQCTTEDASPGICSYENFCLCCARVFFALHHWSYQRTNEIDQPIPICTRNAYGQCLLPGFASLRRGIRLGSFVSILGSGLIAAKFHRQMERSRMVPPAGFEPARPVIGQGILSPSCLPFHHGGIRGQEIGFRG